jgi:serine/threonine-protein kinase
VNADLRADATTTAPGVATLPDGFAAALADRYTIESPLGAGGMATVWRVQDRRHARTLALKVLRAEPSQAITTERFLREVRVAASLQHPGILPLFDSGEIQGVPWYVMPLVAGETLRQRLTRERQLPVDDAVRIARQVAAALAHAHQQGIVHRDVKPENILLADGQVYLADFGIALAMQRADDGRLTQSGFTLGTPQYLSPELAAGEWQVDGRSDQWALAAVLYEMLSGRPPHVGTTFQSLAARIVTEAPTSLAALRPGVPTALDAAIRRALHKVPADRYADTGAFEVALAGALVEPVSTPASAVTNAAASVAPPPRGRRRGRALVAGTVIGLGVLGLKLSGLGAGVAAAPLMRLALVPPRGERFVSGLVEGGAALSPDGERVAYVASSKGATRLWVRQLSSNTEQLIAGTDGAAFPFWSPDGKSVGFFAGDQLKRVALDGSASVVLCPAALGRGGAWTEDGRIVFAANGALSVVSEGGGKSAVLIPKPAPSVLLRWPQMLPGGRLLYYMPERGRERAAMYLASLKDPQESRRVLENETEAVYAQDGHGKDFLTWIRNGSLVAAPFNLRTGALGDAQLVADSVHAFTLSGHSIVSASRSGTLLFNPLANVTSRFAWFDRTGRQQGELGEPARYNEFRLSRDGRQVVAAREHDGGLDLWTIDVARNASARLPTDRDVSTYPAWMPDGRSLLFAAGDVRNIFRRSLTGDEQRLTQSTTHQLPNDVCRDGRVGLFYQVTPQTLRDLWTLALDVPGATPQPYLAQRWHEAFGRFSPDCKWVAYQSDETGRYEVYVASFPKPTERYLVSTTADGGLYPVWTQNKAGALEILYLAPDGMITSVPVSAAAGTLKLGAPHDLFRIPRVDDLSSPFDATADGERLLVRVLSPNAPLSVIVSWPTLLK